MMRDILFRPFERQMDQDELPPVMDRLLPPTYDKLADEEKVLREKRWRRRWRDWKNN